MRIGISGTPGTGKTTLAMELSKILDIPYADISNLALKHGWTLGHDDERGTAIVDVERVREYLDELEDAIVDAHYAELFECDKIFVVRCEPNELYVRLFSRNYGKDKIKENILSEILDTCLMNALEAVGSSKVFEIESGNIKDNIDAIISIISGNVEGMDVGSKRGVRYLTQENLDLLERI